MSVIWWILFAVIWIAIAFWPARVAGRRGHSFIGYSSFSLFLIPGHAHTFLPGRRSHPRLRRGKSALSG